MALRTILLTGLRVLAVYLLLAVCFAVGGALSGLDKIAQQTVASQSVPPANQQVPQMPEDFLPSFLIFTLCAGGTLSYLILRSRWHGWMLAGAIFVSMYGISTVASQLDSIALLSNKLPQGMIRAIFVQGAIAAALFAPLAVLALGKWRGSVRAPVSPAAPLKFGSILLRLAILVCCSRNGLPVLGSPLPLPHVWRLPPAHNRPPCLAMPNASGKLRRTPQLFRRAKTNP